MEYKIEMFFFVLFLFFPEMIKWSRKFKWKYLFSINTKAKLNNKQIPLSEKKTTTTLK